MSIIYNVMPISDSQLKLVAAIYLESFKGMEDEGLVMSWLRCCFDAFPRFRIFGIWMPSRRVPRKKYIAGYIIWQEHGGFRQDAVFELEQIAVSSLLRNKSAGTVLVQESLKQIRNSLSSNGRGLKLVMVTTGAGGDEIEFYKKALGAEPITVLPDIYRGDEQVMIWRPS